MNDEMKIDNLRNQINEERIEFFGSITEDKQLKKKTVKPVDTEKLNAPCKTLSDLEYKNKVKKKRTLTGVMVANSNLDELEQMLVKKGDNILKRPWNKLEPKFKQDRFQHYVDHQDWCEDDKTTVMKLLESALQLNYLIRASEVDYDVENGVIKNIKKLKIEENEEGGKSFTIIPSKPKSNN